MAYHIEILIDFCVIMKFKNKMKIESVSPLQA